MWRNAATDANPAGAAAAAGDDDDDVADTDETDMDRIAFGFMTWQPNATLLHCTSKSTGDMLDIKLVGFVHTFVKLCSFSFFSVFA